MIDFILFDMDGVLVDQIPSLAFLEGVSVEEFLKRAHEFDNLPDNKAKGYSYVVDCILKHLHKEPFVNVSQTTEFFEFKRLMKQWLHEGKRVGILSSSTKQPEYDEITRQKKVWNRNHGLEMLPQWYSRGAGEKKNWAKPGVLLIDDYHKNTKQFEAHGGHAVHHNGNDFDNTIKQLKDFGLTV